MHEAEEMRHTKQEDDHLNILTAYMINGWPSTRTKIKEAQPYWLFRDDTAVINGIVMKSRIAAGLYKKKPWSSYTSPTWA